MAKRKKRPNSIEEAEELGVCGARKRNNPDGERCTLPLGWGTDHPGIGRCKLHGGASPSKHGRYSVVGRARLRDRIEEYMQDPDPLNVMPELARARALLEDYITRYEESLEALDAAGPEEAEKLAKAAVEGEGNGSGSSRLHPLHLDVGEARKLIDLVTTIVARVEKVRSENAISRPELFAMMSEMARVVETYVPDAGTLEKIKEGWLSIRIGQGGAGT